MALTTDQRDLLVKTMDHITHYPDAWDQSSWGEQTACGTAACFGGWAVIIAQPGCRPPTTKQADDGVVWYVNGDRVDIAARKLLGLDADQCYILFDGTNQLDELAAMVQLLLDSNGEADGDALWGARRTVRMQRALS